MRATTEERVDEESRRLERFERACRAMKRQYPLAWRDDLAQIEADGVPELLAIARRIDAEPTASFLRRERASILAAAGRSIERGQMRHYQAAGPEVVHERLAQLFELVVECVASRDAIPLVEHTERVAEERYVAGCELSEVQVALNSLEEATWSEALARLGGLRLAVALTLLSTAFGAAKDALARRYVRLATRAHAPALDVDALFDGSA